jgi:hypothetical protein
LPSARTGEANLLPSPLTPVREKLSSCSETNEV